MAHVVVTLRIMPESVDVDLAKLQEQAKHDILKMTDSREMKINVVPIAFGLKAIDIIFLVEEDKGSTEDLENHIRGLSGVQSAEVTHVTRAAG
jgi:elongation factor 1-beta